MSLRLEHKFGVVQIQGSRTIGKRKFGVPTGGAFDRESMSLGNFLAARPLDDPAWELSMAQATFVAEASGVVSVVGALADIQVGGWSLKSPAVFSVSAGDRFVVEAPKDGARIYVALGSSEKPTDWKVRASELPSSVRERHVLRVAEGPQADRFDRSVLETQFRVSQTINRVGVRLEGSIGSHTIELPSEPQCVGAIQVSNSGALILIGPDGPTIGGYPKIAVVISSDLDRIGQLTPNDQVNFEWCSIDQAHEIARLAAQAAQKRMNMLRLVL